MPIHSTPLTNTLGRRPRPRRAASQH